MHLLPPLLLLALFHNDSTEKISRARVDFFA